MSASLLILTHGQALVYSTSAVAQVPWVDANGAVKGRCDAAVLGQYERVLAFGLADRVFHTAC